MTRPGVHQVKAELASGLWIASPCRWSEPELAGGESGPTLVSVALCLGPQHTRPHT